MANLKERREQEDAWQALADRLGCDLDDVKPQNFSGLISDKRDKKLPPASLPAWFRDRIRASWNEQDKPAVKVVSNG